MISSNDFSVIPFLPYIYSIRHCGCIHFSLLALLSWTPCHTVWWSSWSALYLISRCLPDTPFPVLLLWLLAAASVVNVSPIKLAHIYMNCIRFHIYLCWYFNACRLVLFVISVCCIFSGFFFILYFWLIPVSKNSVLSYPLFPHPQPFFVTSMPNSDWLHSVSVYLWAYCPLSPPLPSLAPSLTIYIKAKFLEVFSYLHFLYHLTSMAS